MTGVAMALAGARTLPALSASLSPTTDSWILIPSGGYGPDYFVGSGTVATASGGASPYTYAWETVSGDAFSSSSTDSVTPFSFSGDPAVIRCLVSDSAGQSVYTNNCSIS